MFAGNVLLIKKQIYGGALMNKKMQRIFILVLLIIVVGGATMVGAAERQIRSYDFNLTTSSESNLRLNGPAYKERAKSVPAAVRSDYFSGAHTVKYTIWTGHERDANCISGIAWLKTGRRNIYYDDWVYNINYIPHYLTARKNTNEEPGRYIRAYGTWSPDDY